MIRLIEKLRSFVTGGGFPAFTLALLLWWELFLVGMLLVPPSQTAFGAFAEEFRVWCFGYDPATGRTEWAFVMAMVLPQLLMGAFIVLFWWEPLRKLFERPRAVALYAGAAALLLAGTAAGFTLSTSQPATGELPFPAEELRTSYEAPPLALTNQQGDAVALSALRGKVVMLTSVYASCPHTCPVILTQAKGAIAELSLEEQQDLRVVAVTMDPQHDSTEVLAELAKNHGMQTPLYNLVTGDVEEVEGILDRMEIARERDPETGVISHVNLFLLIDREGRLAYRLGLGERQQRWLTSALKLLLRESPATL